MEWSRPGPLVVDPFSSKDELYAIGPCRMHRDLERLVRDLCEDLVTLVGGFEPDPVVDAVYLDIECVSFADYLG